MSMLVEVGVDYRSDEVLRELRRRHLSVKVVYRASAHDLTS